SAPPPTRWRCSPPEPTGSAAPRPRRSSTGSTPEVQDLHGRSPVGAAQLTYGTVGSGHLHDGRLAPSTAEKSTDSRWETYGSHNCATRIPPDPQQDGRRARRHQHRSEEHTSE